MTRFLVLILGLGWAFVVFLCTGYLTFPGDALADRAEYEIYTGSNKEYVAELGDISPWWFGASTSELKLFGKADRTGKTPLLVYATDARVAASPLSLLFREPAINGSITLGESGTLYYDIETSTVKERLVPSSVEITGESFPINELLTMIPNMQLTGSGNADVDIALEAPEGLSKANGKIELRGKGLKLINPEIEGVGPLGMDVDITDLDLTLSVSDGKAKITRGKMDSSVARINVTGDLVLADAFGNSTVDLKLEVEPDDSLAMLRQVFSAAEKNGKLEFTCNGRIAALDRACRAGSGSVSKARPSRPVRPATPMLVGSDAKGEKPDPPRTPTTMSPEQREERKKELQERLRKRREERRTAGLAGGDDPPVVKGEEEPLEDEPLEDDPPLDEEELPFEDEEIIEE